VKIALFIEVLSCATRPAGRFLTDKKVWAFKIE